MAKKYEYVRRTITWEGKRYTVRGKTEQEAADKLAELKLSLKRGEKAVGADSTVDNWFKEWYALYKEPSGISAHSLRMYQNKYSYYIQPKIGRMKVKDVREIHLQRILNEEAGRSRSHVKKLLLVMRELFGKAQRTRLILFDPSADLVMPDTTEGKRRSITEEERAHILAVAKEHHAGPWILTLLYAGLRPGEATALQWKDIDFQKNEIHVYKAMESDTNEIKGPKTAAGVRDIPMHPDLRAVLLPLKKAPFDPVFTSMTGAPLTSTGAQGLWRSFKKALDIHMGAVVYRDRIVQSVVAEDLTPYCLRHTFCTDLQRAGVPINIAKELMGHSDISITANIYTHRDQDALHANMDKFFKFGPVTNNVTNNPKQSKSP